MQTCSILSSYLIEVELSFNKCVQSGRSVITHKLIINLLLIAQCNGFNMKQCCSTRVRFWSGEPFKSVQFQFEMKRKLDFYFKSS